MKTYPSTRLSSIRFFCAALLAVAGLSLPHAVAAATYTYWVDSNGNHDWDTGGVGGNWSTTSGGTSGAAVPNGGFPLFSIQDPTGTNLVTFASHQSVTVNDVAVLTFSANGNNYTFGTSADVTAGSTGGVTNANGLYFNPAGSQSAAIVVQGNLTGINGGEDFKAPIDFNNGLAIYNFSPYASTTATMQQAAAYAGGGYGNVLTFDGQVTSVNTSDVAIGTAGLTIGGDGKTVFSSTSILNIAAISADMGGNGTLVIAGQVVSPITLSVGNGNVILDYSVNTAARLKTLAMGGSRNGGNLILDGTSATSNVNETVAGLTAGYGFQTITVNGGASSTVTLNLGTLGSQSPSAGFLDITTNTHGVVTTTSANATILNSVPASVSANIIGQYLTFDENSWATNTGVTTTGTNKIIGGYAGDGDLFNSRAKNFDVDDGGETLAGFAEGANTVRFNGATGGELDLNGGALTMDMGGILVANNVTQNTSIGDGSLTINSGGTVTIFNYGTGVFTLSADIVTNQGLGRGGNGTIVISGNDSAIVQQGIYLMSGTTQLGSTTALGGVVRATPTTNMGNMIYLGENATTVLDLNGYSPVFAGLNSNNANSGGNAAALDGLTARVTNTVAGSISRITLAGNGGTAGDGNPASATAVNSTAFNLNGDSTARTSFGDGLIEGAGSIIALDIQQGTSTANLTLFDLGSNYGQTTFGPVPESGANNLNIFFTGSLTIGAGAGFASFGAPVASTVTNTINIGNINNGTMGVLVDNGVFGFRTGGSFGATYLAGTGSIQGSDTGNLFINLVGSSTDSFAGLLNNPGAAVYISTTGTGSLTLTNATAPNIYLWTLGTSSIIAPSLTGGGMMIEGLGSVTFNTSAATAAIGTNDVYVIGGTLYLKPGGSGNAITYTSAGSNLRYAADGTIVLDKGSNTSLTYGFGNTADSIAAQLTDGTLIVGSAQGIAALGSTDKFVLLKNSTTTNPVTLSNGISTSIFGQDDSTGNKEGAFLTYQGSGAAGASPYGSTADVGFKQAAFTNVDAIRSSTATTVVDIDSSSSTTGNTLDKSYSSFALEVDKNATVTTTGFSLNFLGGDIILNGGSILSANNTAPSVNLTYSSATVATHIYTDLDGGTISSISMAAGASGKPVDLVKDGPGVLTVGALYGPTTSSLPGVNDRLILEGGALDIGSMSQLGLAELIFEGGVLQGNGTFSDTVTDASGGVQFYGGIAGGFSARGGTLTVNIAPGAGNTAGSVIWTSLLGEGGVLEFGSTNSDSRVIFQDNLDLGFSYNQNGSVSNTTGAIYSRVIDVTANKADAALSNPLLAADSTSITGNITNANTTYAGVSKDGNGVLYLLGTNTYTGATTIANGTLVIANDTSLGTAASAAYALNTTQTADTVNGGNTTLVSGNALTPGAIEINGGATLALESGKQTLSANRQLLLASGATGASAAYIDVDRNYTSPGVVGTGYAELDFGGMIADYVNEKGSLEKTGDGTFNYSGTASNTGTMAVSAGTFTVSGAGSVNSASGVTINNKSTNAATAAQFNYTSSVALSEAVTYGTGGGTFAYNSQAVYTGATAMTLAAKDVISGAGKLSSTAFTLGAGSTILPGNVNGQAGTATVGTLTTGGLILQTGGNYNFLLADATGAAGVGYSTVGASSVDLSGLSTGGKFNINLESLALNIPGSAADFNGSNAYTFVLIATNQQITGTTAAQVSALFNVNTAATNGATGLANAASGTWQVVESADGTDLDLVYGMTVPEPSTWVMLAGGLGLLVVIRRSRQRVG